MKIKLLSLVLLGASLTIGWASEYRLFSNADKTSTINATVVDFTKTKDGKKAVLLKLSNGQTKAVPVESLSQEDQTFLKGEEVNVAIAKSVQVEIKEVKGKPQETIAGQRRINQVESSFSIKLRNNSAVEINDLKLSYRVVHKVAKWDDKQNEQKTRTITAGSVPLATMVSRGTVEEKTSPVTLTTNRPYTKNCNS